MGLFHRRPKPEPITLDTGEHFVVAGTKHYQKALKRLAKAQGWDLPETTGEPKFGPIDLELFPQIGNPHDENAIAVVSETHHVFMGHVPAELAAQLRPVLMESPDEMHRARVRGLFYRGQHGGWQVRVMY